MAINYDKYLFSNGTHYISNSGGDENSGTHGGKAGDQTGKEWRLRSWYSRPWTVVLRWPDQGVALRIAQLGIDAALNDKIGYDQYQRDTFWRECKKVGYLPGKITKACEEDCTAGVNGIVHCAGHLLGIAKLKAIPETGIRSGNMRKYFTNAGFRALMASKYLNSGRYLLPGDILLYENHHAATNITCGAKVREQWHPEGLMRSVVITGGTVNVRKGPGTEYDILGVVREGAKLPYGGQTFENGWHLVEYKGQNACVSGKYAELEE